MAKRRHLSARGQPIDFDSLHQANKNVIAVGNANMNANGDVLGRGGKVVRKVSDIPVSQLADPNAAYNQSNPKSTKLVSLKDNVDAVSTSKKSSSVQPKAKLEDVSVDEVEPSEEEKSKSKRKIVDSEE